MSIAEKITQLKTDFDDVYEAGYKEFAKQRWDEKVNFNYYFISMTDELLEASVLGDVYVGNFTFQAIKATDVKAIFERKNAKIIIAGPATQPFNTSTTVKRYPKIYREATASIYTTSWWFGCTALESIDEITVLETDTIASSVFQYCTSLTEIRIDGTIGSTFHIGYSPLSLESCKSIITALKDYSGTENEFSYTLTLSQTAKDNINADGSTSPNGNTWLEYAADKGWNVA